MNLDHALERIHQLETIVGLKEHFAGFSRTHAKILGLLTKRETVTTEMLFDALYGDRADGNVPDSNTLKVHVNQLRNKLKPHGITFKTWYGVGYQMDAENKTKLRDLFKQPDSVRF